MRFSAFFRGQKKDQREILCATADCIARGVDCDPRRAKLALSRTPRHATDSPGSVRASPPKGTTEHWFGAPNFRTTLVGCLAPRTSVYVEPKKPRSQNNLFCLHRLQHSRHCFKPPLKPPLLRFLSVCSVSSVVSHRFRLKTPLLNKRTRNLPGLKPTLRFLARAIRGHVIPRHSAFFRGQKKRINAKSCAQLQTALSAVFTAILGRRSSR
jgi:hypothetical protein